MNKIIFLWHRERSLSQRAGPTRGKRAAGSSTATPYGTDYKINQLVDLCLSGGNAIKEAKIRKSRKLFLKLSNNFKRKNIFKGSFLITICFHILFLNFVSWHILCFPEKQSMIYPDRVVKERLNQTSLWNRGFLFRVCRVAGVSAWRIRF